MAMAIAEYISGVDAVSSPEAVMEKAVKFFTDNGIADASGLDGVVEADLDLSSVPELPVKALVRRTIRMAIKTAEAQRESSSTSGGEGNPPASAVYNTAVQEMLDVMGQDASSSSISQVLASTGKQVHIVDTLSRAGLSKLPFHLIAETALWQLMSAENAQAEKERRVAFSYVDLTAKALLPMWLPSDAVGGKSSMGASEWALDANAPSGTLGALGAALKAATQKPKFFRSVTQWTAVFIRYAPVAVSMSQITWPAVLAHMDVVMRMSEEARLSGDSPFVAILYDDLLRKTLSERAKRRDPELDLEGEFGKVNK